MLQCSANNVKRCLLKPIHYAWSICRSHRTTLWYWTEFRVPALLFFHSVYNVIFWQCEEKHERVWFFKQRFICQSYSCVNIGLKTARNATDGDTIFVEGQIVVACLGVQFGSGAGNGAFSHKSQITFPVYFNSAKKNTFPKVLHFCSAADLMSISRAGKHATRLP